MKCVRCDYVAEKGDKFCRQCGEELPIESTFLCDCGAEVKASDKYCHQCGSMFATNVCDCGFEIPASANYCPGCGIKIEKASELEAEPLHNDNFSVDESNEEDLGLTDLSKPF